LKLDISNTIDLSVAGLYPEFKIRLEI
jgi:hypothetical protein